MREIKFRAWHIGKKKMYTPVCVMFCPNELREYRIFEASDRELLGNDKHFHVMQFTGLKDANGEDIYEGDILVDDTEGLTYDFVEWSDEWAGWTTGNWYGSKELAENARHHEVVGNVYQNPELLK